MKNSGYEIRPILTGIIAGFLVLLSVQMNQSFAQTLRKVEIIGPALGNASSNEVAVVNSTGLVYNAGQVFGNNIGVIDPITNTLIRVIRPTNPNQTAASYSRTNQTTNLVYFLQNNSPNALITVVDGRPASPTFNQLLPPIVFNNQIFGSFAIDQMRHRMYVTIFTTATNPIQSQILTIDINPASASFHQVLSTVALPSGQIVGHVAVNSVTNKIYVATRTTGGGIFVLNGTTQILTQIPNTVPTTLLAIDEGSNMIYGGSLSGSTLQGINGITDSLLTNLVIPSQLTGTLGEQIAVNQTTHRVYALLNNGSLSVIDSDRMSGTFNTQLTNIPNLGFGEVAVDEGLNKIVVGSGSIRTSIIDGATNTVAATTTGNLFAADAVINPVTHRAYIAYSLYGTQAINLNDNSFVNIGTTGEVGEGIINPNNNSFYFGQMSPQTGISFLNRNDVLGNVGAMPHNFGRILYSAQNTQTNRLYIVNSRINIAGNDTAPNYVSVINGATNAVIANVEVGSQPNTMAVNEATNKIYAMKSLATNFAGTSFPTGISVINGATNTATAVNTSAMPTNTQYSSGQIVTNPATNKIYFVTFAGTVGVINGATDVATPVSGLTSITAIAVNSSLNRIYLISGTEFLVMNGATDTLLAGGSFPLLTQIKVNRSNGRVYFLSSTNKTITTIDGNSGAVLSTMNLDITPTSFDIDETRNRIYVANADSQNEAASSVTFIDGNTMTVTKNLPIPIAASRISVNPTTQTVYATTVNASQRTGIVVISDAPTLSPSLTAPQILYTTQRDGNTEIFSMNADGTNQQRITTTTYNELNPHWSPNRRQIVYQSNQYGTNQQISTMNSDGTGIVRLTNSTTTTDSFPKWSPDGSKILFQRRSASGLSLHDLWVMNADGSGQTNLTNTTDFEDSEAAWSPDGTRIVFSKSDDQNFADIYTMNANGTNQQRLTTTAFPVINDFPAWSPDGTKIAFTRVSNFADENTFEIFVMNANGTGQTNITNNSTKDLYPIWSPDGTKISFQANRDGNAEIYTVNANGTSPTRLTLNTIIDQPCDWRAAVPSLTAFDFDGDGRSDISTFRNSNAGWYLNRSTQGITQTQFGLSGDKIVPADYDGDGKTDIAVYRNGTWYLQRSTLGFTAVQWGNAADIPVPADYDGDGKADIAVFRNGIWYVLKSSGGVTGLQWGISTDIPTPADYDGDGKADYAIWRAGAPTVASFYILSLPTNTVRIEAFGQTGDVPLVADYDGDGKADTATYRAGAQSTFYYRGSLNNPNRNVTYLSWGTTGDVATPADYDGDGKADIAVYRNGVWYIQNTATGVQVVNFGLAGDKPIPSAFVP